MENELKIRSFETTLLTTTRVTQLHTRTPYHTLPYLTRPRSTTSLDSPCHTTLPHLLIHHATPYTFSPHHTSILTLPHTSLFYLTSIHPTIFLTLQHATPSLTPPCPTYHTSPYHTSTTHFILHPTTHLTAPYQT